MMLYCSLRLNWGPESWRTLSILFLPLLKALSSPVFILDDVPFLFI